MIGGWIFLDGFLDPPQDAQHYPLGDKYAVPRHSSSPHLPNVFRLRLDHRLMTNQVIIAVLYFMLF